MCDLSLGVKMCKILCVCDIVTIYIDNVKRFFLWFLFLYATSGGFIGT